MKARILRSSQRLFDCRLETGEMIQATALANLLKSDEGLVVGDDVEVKQEGAEWTIHQRGPRRSEIFRLLVRESKKKITAANCDLMLIVASVSKPAYKRGIIDRFLVRAHQWQIQPLVLFNKMDEYDEGELDLVFEADRLASLGVECFELACTQTDYRPRYLASGLAELKAKIKGATAILLGQSGVGKSSAINAMATNAEIALKTQSIGRAGKGSHTTTWSEIIDLGDFDLIDSPGIRSFSLDDIDPTDLISYFPDLEEYAIRCKFHNCRHGEGAQGCAFQELDHDARATQLILSRLESYQRIFEEISSTPQWAKKV